MFRRNNQTRNYQAPYALVTHIALEGNFCQSVLFNVQAKDLENMNDPESENYDASEVFYFDS